MRASTYQRGIIKEVNTLRAQARVILSGSGGLVSWWLDIVHTKAHGDKEIWLPDIGAEVACLIDKNGETGCIFGGIYTRTVPPSTDDTNVHEVLYRDGTRLQYNRSTHHMDIKFATSGTVAITGADVTVTGESATVNADVTINGSLNVSGDVLIGGTQTVSKDAQFLATGAFVGPLSASAISWAGGTAVAQSLNVNSGNLNVNSGDIVADGISLKNHTHISADPKVATSKPS